MLFRSYEDLKGRLEKVLGLNGETPTPKTTVEQMKEKKVARPEPDLTEEDDDDMAYFSKLADD